MQVRLTELFLLRKVGWDKRSAVPPCVFPSFWWDCEDLSHPTHAFRNKNELFLQSRVEPIGAVEHVGAVGVIDQ